MGKFYRTDWIWDIHTNHKETNVCFRLSPAPAKCLNPVDLPSEWWICVPSRQLIKSSFLSHLFQHEPLNSSQTPLVNRTDTHLLSFMGSPCNCFSSHSGQCRQRRELVPGGGSSLEPLLFSCSVLWSFDTQAYTICGRTAHGNQSWGQGHL